MVTMTVRSLACAVLALCAAAPPAPAQGGVTRIAAQVRPARAAAAPAWAVEGVGRPFGGTVTLALDAVPLENALLEIARQAQLRLTYSREALPAELRVSAHATAIRASDAFAPVLRGTELAAVSTSSSPGRT